MRHVLSDTDLRQFRNRVCVATSELLVELGYDGFNMRVLAARLGISAMTTYRYFESKRDIFAALRIQAFNGLADMLESLYDQSASPPERFVALSRAYLGFAREEPIRYRLMFDQSQPQISCPAELARSEQRMFQAFARQAGSCGRIWQPEGSPERFAQILWASLHGIATLAVMGTFDESELDALLLDVVHRFAGPSSGSPAFAEEPRASASEWRPLGADRTNARRTPDRIPLTAAD
jgi:AcrR family transcriptional regulator